MYTSVFHMPPPFPLQFIPNILACDFFFLSDPYVKVTFVARGGDRKVYNFDGQKTHVVKKVSPIPLSLSLLFV